MSIHVCTIAGGKELQMNDETWLSVGFIKLKGSKMREAMSSLLAADLRPLSLIFLVHVCLLPTVPINVLFIQVASKHKHEIMAVWLCI